MAIKKFFLWIKRLQAARMIIAGAGGHGFEVRSALLASGVEPSALMFFDEDCSKKSTIGQVSELICNVEELKSVFVEDNRFVLGVGSPHSRRKLFDLMKSQGGIPYFVNASFAVDYSGNARHFDLMAFSMIGPNVLIGSGALINVRANIHHDCQVGNFTEISPGAMLLGASEVGAMSRVGAGAVILPNVKLGNEVVVAAGSVVTKNFGDGVRLKGIPAAPF